VAGRFELKYRVDTALQARLRPVLASRLVRAENLDADGAYSVLSQYYDGPDLPFYFDKVAGIERRVKVRLRTYGWSFGSHAPWFLELKKKENAAIGKVRVVVRPGSIDPFDPTTWDAIEDERIGPILAVRDLMQLEPTAQVWYHREALADPNSDLRITWDNCVRALYPGESMSRELLYDPRRAAIPERFAVAEVKAAQTLPDWLTDLIRRASLVPEAISKYVHAVNALGLSRKVLATC
jgi:hypothetical protein